MTEYKVIFHIDEINKWKLLLNNVINLLDAAENDKFYENFRFRGLPFRLHLNYINLPQ